jgi:hypothetical protein
MLRFPPIRILALLLMVLSASTVAQESNAFKTAEMGNGRVWQRIREGERVAYVMAYIDMLVASRMIESKDPDSIKAWYAFGFQPGDYVKALDTLYAAPENIRIPIPFALRHCTARLSGAMSDKELAEDLTELRGLAARWAARGL